MLVLLSVGVVYYAIVCNISHVFTFKDLNMLNSGQSSVAQDSNAEIILNPIDTKVFLRKRGVNSSHVKEHCVLAVSISVP